MATLHETAYPRLKPDPTAKELEEIYTPTAAEIAFAKQLTTQPGPQLAVLIHLKLFQRLGYFTVLAGRPCAPRSTRAACGTTPTARRTSALRASQSAKRWASHRV